RLAPAAVLLSAVGCSVDAAPPPRPPATPSPPPAAERQVTIVYTGVSDERLRGLDYALRAVLGEPVDAGCDLAAPAGTVTVPVQLTLVNTHEPDDRPDHESGDSEPVLWSAPRYLEAEPVGGTGPLRWEPERPGHPCTDQPDLKSHVSLGWENRDQAVLTGYLTGVPESDRAGAGIRLEVARGEWDVHEGDPEPLAVTY